MKIAVVHNLRPGGAKRVLYEQVKRLSKNHLIDIYTLTSANDRYFPLNNLVSNYYEIEYSYPEHFPAKCSGWREGVSPNQTTLTEERSEPPCPCRNLLLVECNPFPQRGIARVVGGQGDFVGTEFL